MSEDTKVEKKSEKKTDDGLAAKVRHLEEKVQRMSENWKKFAETHLGVSASDGKLGMAKVGFVLVLAVALCAGLVMARDVANWGSTDIGTAKITTADAGAATLTVDTVTAGNISFSGTYTGLTGTILISNVTASGTINAVLVTNSLLVVRGTNISASGAFQVGQSSTGSYTTAMGPIMLSQPPGVVNSNAPSLWMYFQKNGSTNWYALPAFQCTAP